MRPSVIGPNPVMYVEAEGKGSPIVLDYSYGGFLAQLYTILHPENVAGPVLLGADPKMKAFALIWQGHMLDLLGKRAEAVKRYRKAAEMNITDTWAHGQYGLKYQLSPYALERVKIPFKRIENNALD